ncbi:ABC transporter ATP-binding protein [Vannielia litorea]|uniref:Peptide/nickel transport system ATP-binding protein n=1 Tax=Vannielia litorea TaxID=1217970 RepID=A0A1N6E087_9RHOB|nr:ABC transporter ATP-binding protein [Vannielia litorea]SIN76374.1 peptide/nickel transport system ATP-binding protein [Vannielia litorea]
MSEPVLEIRGLNKQFPIGGGFFRKPTETVRAVEGISFDVHRGEAFGIVGESGSGKTTLGRCIMRILAPSAGEMRFRDKSGEVVDLVSADNEALRRVWQKVRMVFQDPQSSLNPRLRVIDLIGQSLKKSEGLTGTALAERVSDLLEQVGLRREFLHRYPNAFSGGQRQRLGIARALATSPEVIIADEAVSALDVSIQAQTLNLLQDLQDELGLTYVFIAHDLAVVEHFCDRIAVMYRGQVVELSETDELFARPKHPYTRSLLEAVPIPDPRARKVRQRKPVAPSPIPMDACRFSPRCPHATELCRTKAPPSAKTGGADVLCHYAGEI